MTTPSRPGESVSRAGTREWIGLAVLVLPTMLVSMDMSVLGLGEHRYSGYR